MAAKKRKRGQIYLKEMVKVLDAISQPFSDIIFTKQLRRRRNAYNLNVLRNSRFNFLW